MPLAPRTFLKTIRVWAFVVGVLFTSGPVIARIEVNVSHVGFPTVRKGNVVRAGAWTPIIVDLDLVEQATFDGALRAAQLDSDGDQCFDGVDVHLQGETGGVRRFLYVLSRPIDSEARFSVELTGVEGEVVEMVSQGAVTARAEPTQKPTIITDDELLVLSVSTGTIGAIQTLADADDADLYQSHLNVGHISPAELPDLWIGLESVDFILWDEAKPEDLSAEQRTALLEWVRQGGTLLLSATRTAGSVRQSVEFEKALPVEIGGSVMVKNLPRTRERLVGRPRTSPTDPVDRGREEDDDWFLDPFPIEVMVTRCTARAETEVVAADHLNGPEGANDESPIVARRRLGRGHVIFSAVSVADLLSAPGYAPDFFVRLFHVAERKQEEEVVIHPLSLFGHVVGAVAFATSGSVYLLVASLFSTGYLAAATGGTWWFLGRRGWRRHSWTAFALVAAAASVLSIIGVGWVKGFGDRVHQMSVIDFEAGERHGAGTVYFGLKTGSDRELDLWLPPDATGAREPEATACFLRPLPSGADPSQSQLSFADPEAYRVVPASAVIEGVRIRGTLKRFEGRWSGPLSGTVTGKLTFADRSFTDDSAVTNGLGVELKDCYLLHAELDLADRSGKPTASPRDEGINAYSLGTLAAGESSIPLVPLLYPERKLGAQAPPAARPTLKGRQGLWGAPLTRSFDLGLTTSPDATMAAGEEQNALLLASTVGEFDPTTLQGVIAQVFGRNTWSRDRLRQFDLRLQMRPDCAILIGFADDPGPARLFRRSGAGFRPIEPDSRKSRTMYRIRIPVTVVERTSAEEDEAESGTY